MDIILIALVTSLAASFRGMTGFGFALVAAIGLASWMPAAVMVPFILVNDLILTALILRDRTQAPVDWPVVRLLLIAGFAGALCGGALASALDDATAKLLVAIATVVAAGAALVRRPPSWLRHRLFGTAIGFLVGMLLAAFAVGGPLIAAWLLTGGTERRTLRGTLAVFFGVVEGFSLASRALFGVLGPGLLEPLLLYLPFTLAGYALGHFIARRTSPHRWMQVASGGLLAVAVAGFAQTLHALSV